MESYIFCKKILKDRYKFVTRIFCIILLAAATTSGSTLTVDTVYQNHLSFQSNSLITLNQLDRGVQWEVALSVDSPDGTGDTAVFGEADDAHDGPPADSYDVPDAFAPPEPYVRAWFDDNLSVPYDKLWKDYRSYPDTEKIWNLTVLWFTLDFEPTTVTVTWDAAGINLTEYDFVMLTDESHQPILDMTQQSSYSYVATENQPYEFFIHCSLNIPPQTPAIPTGPTALITGEEGEYCTSTTDMNHHQVQYRFHWGDGTISDWTDLVPSGTQQCLMNSWDQPGIYPVRAQARDELGAESVWSDELPVTISEPPALSVRITRPRDALYINDNEITKLLFNRTIIIGGVTIEAETDAANCIVEKVEFYIDDLLKETDIEAPYSWYWNERKFFRHIITVKAYGSNELEAQDSVQVLIFNLGLR